MREDLALFGLNSRRVYYSDFGNERYMGFKSGFKKFSKTMFNFRPDLWLDYKNLKGHTDYFYRQFKNLYHIPAMSKSETFEETERRLQLTPEMIQIQKKQNTFLMYFYLCLFCCILCYCLWLICFGNIMGSFMSLAVALYALSFAFRYHFWNYQIEKRDLSCGLKKWFLDFTRSQHNSLAPKIMGMVDKTTQYIKGKWA